ncbi:MULTISPECIES: helix-turn-helix domain-containing protein [unclassified Neisseria]|uniref:helix-turn-helix domain-containing protein n=1 Tax=unclassified Neisseria TaxID=2623750 RepID=UPI002665AA85|nr:MULTISPECIES: helix-turn-helix transcriptional regulator [unclassified Neisseria]MDO1508838.1 helix-turn-helix transcriptional regulator [Neisseria sp. MVDL19-042950]MDO1515097.1 helix-turn-helix transcriptional regulator [Neisseria sp. MVDL18-041461]MDO1562457.1 helix-turn-helix transcriptional regulator [Neisseria sp. MVDL20-010259]
MGLTQFGAAVREARRQTKQTLQTMATALGTSPAFLSAIETGRSKVPMDFVEKVEDFFKNLNQPVADLKQKAMVSNENVSLSGLSLQQQMLVAGFASSEFSKEQLEKFAELLRTIHKDPQKEDENV